MHAYRNPSHELALQEFVAQCGFHTVVCSHQVCPLPRLVPRGQTTLVEAAVARINELSGKVSDPRVVEAFNRAYKSGDLEAGALRPGAPTARAIRERTAS